MEQALQNLWAHTTLDVVNRVAWKQGERMYRNDWNLREDLHSWLLVKAQKFANEYTLDPKDGSPENRWAGTLWNVLTSASRWHWSTYHNQNEANMEAARRTVHMSTLIEDRDGQTMALPLMAKVTGTPELSPEAFYEKLEHLEETLQHLQSGPLPPKPETCIEWGCDAPALKSKPRCQEHNERNEAWHGTGERCTTQGCQDKATNYRGLCPRHYSHLKLQGPLQRLYPTCTVEGCGAPLQASLSGLCKPHYQQQYLAAKPTCAVNGCETKQRASGLCLKHYKAAQPFKECCIEGCTSKVNSRGLCNKHYKQLRKQEKANG